MVTIGQGPRAPGPIGEEETSTELRVYPSSLGKGTVEYSEIAVSSAVCRSGFHCRSLMDHPGAAQRRVRVTLSVPLWLRLVLIPRSVLMAMSGGQPLASIEHR